MKVLSHEQLTALLRFNHPEKVYQGLSEAVIAEIHGIPLDAYQQVKSECEAATQQAAAELLADPEFAAQVERLPFAPGATIVGIGDSITDDWLSWLEILRALLTMYRPHDEIRVVNAAVSGETTAQMFYRVFFSVAAEDPDWIICMAGTNDARKYGRTPLKVEISPEETAKNLAQLRDFAATQTSAQWVWMTPTPVLPELIRSQWNGTETSQQIMWMSEDVSRVADLVRGQKDKVVDLQPIFGMPPSPYYLFDGLHPSLSGQILIVRALVEQLSEGGMNGAAL